MEHKGEDCHFLFAQEVFDSIYVWYRTRPQIQSPYVRDMLALNDYTFRPQQFEQLHEDHDNNKLENNDLMDMPLLDALEATKDNTHVRSTRYTSSKRSRATGMQSHLAPLTPDLLLVCHRASPFKLSILQRLLDLQSKIATNTSVHRKSVSSDTVITEARKATGAVIAQQMHDIAKASGDLEWSKFEVQLRLHSEKMVYH